MILLGSKAAAAPTSLDKDNPTLTSSAGMERPTLAAKPVSFEGDA